MEQDQGRPREALDDPTQVQGVGPAQIRIPVPEAGVELDRQLLGRGLLQGLDDQEVAEGLVGQAHPSGLRHLGPGLLEVGHHRLQAGLDHLEAGAVGHDALQGHHALRPGPAHPLHEGVHHLAQGGVALDQLLGQALQAQDGLHPAGEQGLHLRVAVGLVRAVAVVAEEHLDVGLAEEMDHPLRVGAGGPGGQHRLQGGLTAQLLGQPGQARVEEEAVGHVLGVDQRVRGLGEPLAKALGRLGGRGLQQGMGVVVHDGDVAEIHG